MLAAGSLIIVIGTKYLTAYVYWYMDENMVGVLAYSMIFRLKLHNLPFLPIHAQL